MLSGSSVLLGQYRPIDSYLHHLDARAKMVPITLVLILSLVTSSQLFYLISLGILLVGLLTSGVKGSVLLANVKPLLFLILITAFYHILFSGGESKIIFSWWWLTIREVALMKASFYSLRLALFVSVAFLLTLTSSPSELAEAFASLIRPLKKFKVPVDDISLILFMAIRFIPVLYEEFMAIRNAQIVRGVNFAGSFLNRIRRSGEIIIPVFVAAIGRADDIALAIQARGYGKTEHRTVYTQASFGKKEIIFIILSGLLLSLLFWITY